MNKQEIINKTTRYVKTTLAGQEAAHDWWHIERVCRLAKRIANAEKADSFIVELTALLHDIADYKFHDGDSSVGPKVARVWFESINVDKNVIADVCNTMEKMSFSSYLTDPEAARKQMSKEGLIVQDADRLDAIGAIGIARTFTYGGYKKRELYNPSIKPKDYLSSQEYRKNTAPTINHFEEKLLKIKDWLNTDTAKQIAIHRHLYMEQFLEEFYGEWNGER